MDNDGLMVYDVERVILTGRIRERQRDALTDEWKYCVRGQTAGVGDVEVVAQLGPTGRLVIITVYVI